MEPTAFSCALGIIAFVVSYSCFGVSATLALATAGGTTLAIRAAYYVAMSRKRPAEQSSHREQAPTVRQTGTARAKSLAVSNRQTNFQFAPNQPGNFATQNPIGQSARLLR